VAPPPWSRRTPPTASRSCAPRAGSPSANADLVVQQLATASACADQAQVFCAVDFDAEIGHRRGLVSKDPDRPRPALTAFRIAQRLLNGVDSQRFTEEPDGLRRLDVTRTDGLTAAICWRAAGDVPDTRPLLLEVPAFTFVSDAVGQLLYLPRPYPHTIPLPPPTTDQAGGRVRILL
jgi:hypothetical protein